MMRGIISAFSWRYPSSLVYMLQSTEYQVRPYLAWLFRSKDFSNVAIRRSLQLTAVAKLLLVVISLGMILQIIAGFYLFFAGINGGIFFGIAALISYPVVWALLITLPLLLGRWLIISPKENRHIKASADIFHNHKGTIIAVAGSYGKTTMKELLLTILSEGKKIVATPGNKNVAVSHAYFAKKLKGDEDVVIVEFGEGKPNDVKKFTATTDPDYAVITGLAPAHLDKYKTIEAIAEDIFSLAKALPPQNVYVNSENFLAQAHIPKNANKYSGNGVGEWRVNSVECSLDGTTFKATYNKETITFKTFLMGRHQVGPLMAAIALAYELGLTIDDIKRGVAKTAPFEHRMQPYKLGGAWIIDDTYNGNIEGAKAGLTLLKELPAKRKIYVTPGFVDQGKSSSEIHQRLGLEIAITKPDTVVLMQNSTTKDIQSGLEEGNYRGDVTIQDNPLQFYTGLDQFVAAGDLVLMQNDWTDNYL